MLIFLATSSLSSRVQGKMSRWKLGLAVIGVWCGLHSAAKGNVLSPLWWERPDKFSMGERYFFVFLFLGRVTRVGNGVFPLSPPLHESGSCCKTIDLKGSFSSLFAIDVDSFCNVILMGGWWESACNTGIGVVQNAPQICQSDMFWTLSILSTIA